MLNSQILVRAGLHSWSPDIFIGPSWKRRIVWLMASSGLAAFAFIVSASIPFFAVITDLLGALFVAPLCISLPPLLWASSRWKHVRCTNLVGVVTIVVFTLVVVFVNIVTLEVGDREARCVDLADIG